MASSITYRLDKVRDEDYDLYFQLVGNAEVMAMITDRPFETQEAQAGFEKLLEQNKVLADFGHFKISATATGAFMGFAKLVVDHKEGHEAEIGFMLLPQFWGHGIAGSATEELIASAKSMRTIRKIKAVLDPQNKASRKILVDNGFVSESLGEIDGLPEEVMYLLIS